MNDTQHQALEQLMRGQQFDQALIQLHQQIQDEPTDTEAIYLSAVCHRYLNNSSEARAALAHLHELSPGLGRAYQEEGHLWRDEGNDEAALRAYSRATQANPALIAAWRAQAELLLKHQRTSEANRIKPQLERLLGTPKSLLSVTHLLAEGKLLKAEKLCRAFLQKAPHHPEGMRLLAEIGVRMNVLDDAELLLESAVQLAPNDIHIHMDYVQVLRKRQKFARSKAEAKKLLDSQPLNSQFRSLYAIECMQSGDFQEAIDLFDQVLAQLPGEAITLTSRGHALKTWGKTEQAIASYRDAIKSKPAHGEAWYSLANLKTVSFNERDISVMLAQKDTGDLAVMDSIYLYFALGKAYEDNQQFDTSFHYYALGNQAKKANSSYKAEQIHNEFESQKKLFTPAFIQSRTGAGCDAEDPIFIVGLPRAGSTLLEQILSSHSQVEGTSELANILSLVHHLRRGHNHSDSKAYPELIAELPLEKLREFGQAYIAETKIHRHGTPFFIDKMPNNFRHIGLLKLILPKAKIIDARRHPMACCFSGYKQLFAEGQEFSYSLSDIGQYYSDYLNLMDHWQKVFPNEILLVEYEQVVDDFEPQVRRLLDYCGLAFEPACLDFYKTQRAVRTASSEQVRQPLYRSGLDQWQNFEPWLDPLKKALGDIVNATCEGQGDGGVPGTHKRTINTKKP